MQPAGGRLAPAAIALALILSLAGAQIVRAVDGLTVVYLLDLSDSVPAAERERAEAFVREGIGQMPPAIARPSSPSAPTPWSSGWRPRASLPQIASVPVASRTDLAAAVQLAWRSSPKPAASAW